MVAQQGLDQSGIATADGVAGGADPVGQVGVAVPLQQVSDPGFRECIDLDLVELVEAVSRAHNGCARPPVITTSVRVPDACLAIYRRHMREG